LNRIEAVKLKADVLARVRQTFDLQQDENSEIEIFRETAGQIILRARSPHGVDGRPVMLMVTVTELRSWK
jgi:hypothetical protein